MGIAEFDADSNPLKKLQKKSGEKAINEKVLTFISACYNFLGSGFGFELSIEFCFL